MYLAATARLDLKSGKYIRTVRRNAPGGFIFFTIVVYSVRKVNEMRKILKCFDPKMIMESGQIFRMYEDVPGVFTVYSADRILVIKRTQEEDCFDLSCTEEEFSGYWEHYLDCGTDYEGLFRRVAGASPDLPEDIFLRNAAEFSKGIRVLNQDLFEMMISFIISQQKRIPDIRRCIEALCTRFGRPTKGLNAFPTPEAIAAAGREGVSGMSLGYREPYVYEAAVHYLSDEVIQSGIIRNMTYDNAKSHLKTYLGIGNKVADCICLFALGHRNAFPVDVHIKDILKREYGIGDTTADRERINGIYSEYSPYRGIVQQWIFAYEINKKI